MDFNLVNVSGYFYTFSLEMNDVVEVKVFSLKGLDHAIKQLKDMFNHVIVTCDDIRVNSEGWEE